MNTRKQSAYLRSTGEFGNGERVGFEGQSRAARDDSRYLLSCLVGQVSDDGEYRNSGQDAGECIGQRDNDRVSVGLNYISLWLASVYQVMVVICIVTQGGCIFSKWRVPKYLLVNVVLVRIVAGHGGDRSGTDAQRKETLSYCFVPYLYNEI